MVNGVRAMVLLSMAWVFSSAYAETVYVAERMRIGLRAETIDTSPVVKTIESDTALEVLQRVDRFAQVRDPQGATGWIETRYLSAEAPARLQLATLQEELTKARAQLTDAQAQLKKSQVSVSEQTAKLKELEKATPEKTVTSIAAPAAVPPAAVKPTPSAGYRFSFLWLAFSFAMLGMGFVGGILWLRESIRRRSGGMYLRV